MAIDYDFLKGLPKEQGYDYLRQMLSGGLGTYTPGTEGEGSGEAYIPGEAGYYANLGKGVPTLPSYEWEGNEVSPWGPRTGTHAIIESSDPSRSYVAQFDPEGNFIDVGRQLADSWYDKEVMGVPLGAFLPLAGAAAGAYFPPGMEGLVSGAGSEVALGGTAADTLGTTAAGFGELGSGTFGMNAAYTPATLAAAESAVLPTLTPAMTSLGYTALPGAAALGEGVLGLAAGPGAAGPMSFLDASKSAIAAGAEGGLSASPFEALLTAGKSAYSTAKDAYTTAKPAFDLAAKGKKVYDALTGKSGPNTTGTSGLGGLGGLGGILALGLLMSQLNRDRNAQPQGATPVIPRLRSRVQQNAFTIGPNGEKIAPKSYFGEPQYYAAGGGIGGLAGGGQASRPIRGDGDGVSDSIPAEINGSEPAALADGEFVIDARTVAELGNGSSDAGTRKLEAMVARVHEARAKARRGEDSGADRHMPV